MTLEIRDVTAADADAATEVMRRSITEFCLADHNNDPKILGSWLANKRPEIFLSWLQQGNQSYLVAVDDGLIVCVGGVTATARRFYLARGYVETGTPDRKFGTESGFPTHKALVYETAQRMNQGGPS
jgi:hypothetical protein